MRGAKRIAELASQAGVSDLVICLISGGASALMPFPAEGISLAEKKAVTRQLLACGATIHEINTVRKHLSAIKGGQLAQMASPAKVLSLILSDVVGDDLDIIGSGPTVPDLSTVATATAVLRKYRIEQRVSQVETPKPGDPLFANVENVIIGSNQKSLDAAAKKARGLGYRRLILSSTIEGETRDVARMHAAIARQIRRACQPVRPPVCIISGGETTVTIRGKGRGGRNQEFVLAAAIDIAGLENVVVLSAGTDGTDGPTTAAGAIADGSTVSRSKIDASAALTRNDSHTFFAALNDLIITGPTGTNVMDIRILLIR
jgi:hydroxypyruvate reductase